MTARVIQFSLGREAVQPIWWNVYYCCVLCLNEADAVVCTPGPWECSECHQMSCQAVESWEGPPATMGQVLARFPEYRR